MEELGRSLSYKAVSVLGEGAHGVVMLVEHKRLAKRFVMKLIQQKFLANREVVGRFIAEAQRGAKLSHEAFAPIVDLGETDDGRTYFVMEYVEGVTLQQALRERGFFALDEAIDLALQLLDGLAAAHDEHLIHRDIKPANLFLTTRGRLKILDLGISKSILDTGTGPHTAAGIAIGTPKYMSPEQALGRSVTYSTDLYAVGLVLFEMLAGVPAFDGTGTQDILRHQVYSIAPLLEQRAGRAFPPAIESLVARALLKEPQQRFQTAREMMEAIRAARAASSSSSPAVPTTNENVRLTARLIGPPHPGGHATGPVASGPTTVPSSPPPSHSEATRPVPADALVIGAASTSQQAVIVPPSHVELGTARTVAVPSLQADMPHDTGGATTRTHDEEHGLGLAETTSRASREPRPLLLLAAICGGLALVLASAALLVFVLRGPRDLKEPAHAATPTAPPAVAAPPSATAPMAPASGVAVPAPSTSASITPSASASSPKTSSTAKAKASHYQAAVEAMNAGDLETADAEARLAVAQGGGTPAQMLHAQILEKRGKKAAAREIYRQILEKDPTMAAAVAGLKRCGG